MLWCVGGSFCPAWSCNHWVPQKLLSTHKIIKALSPHQRSFFVQWMVVSTETISVAWKMLGQKWDIWSTLLPPHLRVQGQRWRILELKCLLNMTGPTQNYSGLHNSCGGLYTNCTKKSSMSTSQHGGERAHKLPPPAEDQWKADSC